jgi:hypothetical protein
MERSLQVKYRKGGARWMLADIYGIMNGGA